MIFLKYELLSESILNNIFDSISALEILTESSFFRIFLTKSSSLLIIFFSRSLLIFFFENFFDISRSFTLGIFFRFILFLNYYSFFLS